MLISPPALIDALDYPCVKEWLRPLEPVTQKGYGLTFKRFLREHSQFGNSPDQFLEFANECLRARKTLPLRILIHTWADTQRPSVQNNAVKVIRSFLRANEVGLVSKNPYRLMTKKRDGYTAEESQKLISHFAADHKPLYQLYCLFLRDTGLRVHTVHEIKYKHLKKDLDRNQQFVGIRFEDEQFYQGKKRSGVTFIGPATVQLLKELLEEPVKFRSYEWAGRARKDTVIVAPTRDPEANIFPFQYRAGWNMLNGAMSGLKIIGKQPAHGFRHLFKTSAFRAGIPESHRELLTGQQKKIDWIYIETKAFQEVRPSYEKLYPFLASETGTVDAKVVDLQKQIEQLESIKDKDLEAIEAVVKENQDLKGRLSQLDDEMSLWKQQVEVYERKLSQMPFMEARIQELEKRDPVSGKYLPNVAKELIRGLTTEVGERDKKRVYKEPPSAEDVEMIALYLLQIAKDPKYIKYAQERREKLRKLGLYP